MCFVEVMQAEIHTDEPLIYVWDYVDKAFSTISYRILYTGVASVKARIGKWVIEKERRQSVKLKSFWPGVVAWEKVIQAHTRILTAFTNFGSSL